MGPQHQLFRKVQWEVQRGFPSHQCVQQLSVAAMYLLGLLWEVVLAYLDLIVIHMVARVGYLMAGTGRELNGFAGF